MINTIKKTGRIYKGVGIYKQENNGRYYAILMNGQRQGVTLCSCSKLKLIKEFIDNVLNLVSIKDIEDAPLDNLPSDVERMRNEYWFL